MAEQKKSSRVSYPFSEKIYVSGAINKVRVGMRRIRLTDTSHINEQGETIIKKNNPVIVYDTSGPWSDPKKTIHITTGIPRIREEWYDRRKDIQQISPNPILSAPYPLYQAKEGKIITQMHYAKRRIITPEMEYVAIRENQQVEALGLKSYITPDYVRKEIAAGRAVIPSNINHPEAEPMIIGKKFLVKTCIAYESNKSVRDTLTEKIAWNCKWGCDMILDRSHTDHIAAGQNTMLRFSPVPVGSVPIYEALAKVDGDIGSLSWPVFRDTLIEQAERGIDFIVIHAALLRNYIDMAHNRLTGIVSEGGAIMAEWMRMHQKENFLYTCFTEICELLKAYDITLCLGDGLRPGSIYDANDRAHFAELQTKGQLTRTAWEHFIQILIEGPGRLPLNKIHENIKEQQYHCQNAPYLTFGPRTTDIGVGYDHITSAIGSAQIAWNGAAILGCVSPGEYTTREEDRDTIIACKIAAHTADLAKGHPGAQARDNAIGKARVENRRKDACHLAIEPDQAIRDYRRQNRMRK